MDGTAASTCGHGGGTCQTCPAAFTCRGAVSCGVDYQSTWNYGVVSVYAPLRKDGSPPSLYVIQDGHVSPAAPPSRNGTFSQLYPYTALMVLRDGAKVQVLDHAPSGDVALTAPVQAHAIDADFASGAVLLSTPALNGTGDVAITMWLRL